MSVDSDIFLKEIHEQISETVHLAMHSLAGSDVLQSDLLGGGLEFQDVEMIRSMKLSQEQETAFKKLFTAIGRLTATGILSIIDGIAMSDNYDLPDLNLVNRNTGVNITDDMPLNEKFIYLSNE